MTTNEALARVLKDYTAELLSDWNTRLAEAGLDSRIGSAEVRSQAHQLLALLAAAVSQTMDTTHASWGPVRDLLEQISSTRAQQGFTSSETATFVFSLKRPLFERLRAIAGNDAQALADQTWAATALIDALGLHTIATFQRTREDIILRQREELLELSTPVVKLWDGVVALPMIGTLDSSRTQIVMEALLQRIVETSAETAIIDITGVPTVDTLVAQHLLKTVSAIRLMGAECIISGIRPQIAQTIVHLGLELQGVITKANLADALAIALSRNGLAVTKKSA